jgi:prevent-host-death family protein
MPQVGIRELKNETSEILRAVREEKAEYLVTHRGKPVAVILPLDDDWEEMQAVRAAAAARAGADFWARWDTAGAELDAEWQSDKSAVELVEEQRR